MRVGVHWLFGILLAVAAGAGYGVEALILLGSLLAHEIAHLAVAWVLGIPVEELILTPFGGMARMDAALELDPQAETSIALAGPFQSFFLAGFALFLTGDQFWDQELVRFAFLANANLAFFNLIPALPLDGGRALRGLMAQRWGYQRVSGWMAVIGRFTGTLLAATAALVLLKTRQLYLTPLVGGLFLALGAGEEAASVTLRTYRQLLHKREQLLRRRVMPVRPLVAVEGTPLREVMEHLTSGDYHTVVVVDSTMQPVGTLFEGELVEAFTELGPEVPVEAVLDR